MNRGILINRKLKTVPLRELCGDLGRQPKSVRIGIIVMVLLEAAVIGVVFWRVFL